MFAASIRFGFGWFLLLCVTQPRVRSSYMDGHCHATGYSEGDVHATSWDATGRHIEAARGHHESNAGRTGVGDTEANLHLVGCRAEMAAE